MQPLPVKKNPSYFELKNQINKLTDRLNIITQNGKIVDSSGSTPSLIFADDSWTVAVPPDRSEEIVALEAEIVALEAEIVALDQEIAELEEVTTGGGSCAAYYRHGSYYSFNGVICVEFDGVSTAVCTINSTCISWPSGGGGAGGNATFRGSFYDASGGALGSTSAQLTAAFDFTSTGVITTESSSTITESVPSGAVRVEWHQPSPPYTRFATVYI